MKPKLEEVQYMRTLKNYNIDKILSIHVRQHNDYSFLNQSCLHPPIIKILGIKLKKATFKEHNIMRKASTDKNERATEILSARKL